MKPELVQFVSDHKNVRLVEYNVENPGKEAIYSRYKESGQGIPQVVLLDATGNVVTKWVGYMPQAGVDQELLPHIK